MGSAPGVEGRLRRPPLGALLVFRSWILTTGLVLALEAGVFLVWVLLDITVLWLVVFLFRLSRARSEDDLASTFDRFLRDQIGQPNGFRWSARNIMPILLFFVWLGVVHASTLSNASTVPGCRRRGKVCGPGCRRTFL